MLSPAITHLTCDLDLQRRLREARADGAARSLRRRRRGRWSRRPRPRPAGAVDLRDRGDDVWHAFRF